MTKKPTRDVFHSVPNPNGDGWVVESQGKVVSNHRKQATAEAAAIKAGHKAEDGGGLEQAVLHKADGTIREDRKWRRS